MIADAWLNSKAHRANLLNRKYRHIGAGIAWGSPRAGDPKDAIAGIFTANLGYAKPY